MSAARLRKNSVQAMLQAQIAARRRYPTTEIAIYLKTTKRLTRKKLQFIIKYSPRIGMFLCS